MQSIQLYIEGQRVDMFKDESVSITQSIQNVKDIAKVFTEFTKTFTLPASKANNKIFKHYYNFDITGGFDARTKKDATLELNYLPFKKGKIKLEGVDLQNRRPKSYRITFFGNTVTLKDLLGEDKLSALTGLNSLNETYAFQDIKDALQRSPSSYDVIVPLITHSQRLYYDSSEDIKNTGNVYYKNTGNKHGVRWDELKYALRVRKIIEAIEDKYDIEFSTDFFSSTNAAFDDLYLWLHRKKGFVTSDTAEYSKLIDEWTYPDFGTYSQMVNTSTIRINQGYLTTDFDLILTRTGTNPYSVSITRNGTEIYSETSITATSKNIDLSSFISNYAEYTLTIGYEATTSFTDVSWSVDYSGGSDTYSTGSFSLALEFEFVITEQIPEIKVIDFLTGLFKMFNLTTFVEEDGTIYVDTLNDFYASKKSISTAYDLSLIHI